MLAGQHFGHTELWFVVFGSCYKVHVQKEGINMHFIYFMAYSQ